MREAQQSVHVVAASVGFASFALLWLSVVWGIALRNGWGSTRWRHATTYGVHRTATLVALTLGLVHALAQLAVPGGPVRLVDEILPFANPSDPVGIGLGVLGLELTIALVLSVLVQRVLGYHRWSRIHLLGYVAYGMVTAHVLLSGSDTSTGAVRLPIVLSLIGVLLTVVAAAIAQAVRRRLVTPGSLTPTAKLSVDPSRCVRYGFCVQAAPALFDLRSDGRLAYRSAVPALMVDDAVRAADACPARAVLLQRRDADAPSGRPVDTVAVGPGPRSDPSSSGGPAGRGTA